MSDDTIFIVRFSAGFTSLPNVEIDIFSPADNFTWEGLDYNNPASALSQLVDKTTINTSSSHYMLKDTIMKNSSDTITIASDVTVTANKVTIRKANITELDARIVKDPQDPPQEPPRSPQSCQDGS